MLVNTAKSTFFNLRMTKILFGLSMLMLIACNESPKEYVIEGSTMGTFYRIVLVSNDSSITQETIQAEVNVLLDAVNRSMSTYIPDSELSKVNRLAAGQRIQISALLNDVMVEALRISELSGGAFDATVGKAVRIWGFAEDGSVTVKPSQKRLAELKRSTGFENIQLEQRVLTKLVNGLEINLSAIAKGYAVDKIALVLDEVDIRHYLIDIGGELRAKGKNKAGNIWRVGVEKPSLAGGLQSVIELENQAIATSGDYRNFLTIEGKQYSHTIDPNTLEPVLHKLASVSVMHESSMTADALATAILSMGERKGIEFAQKNNLAAYFIIREETADNFTIHSTDGFTMNLVE